MTFRLGPLEVHGEIARGGMGVVLRAEHRERGLPLAVKVIAESFAHTTSFADDFRREVQAAARLTHPHVVTLYEYGTLTEDDARASDGELVADSPFLVMELADAGSLQEHRPRDWPSLLALWSELLDALAHAHARGVVHRDLKPGNVLLHRGGGPAARVKLADFGIAHASDRHLAPGEARLATMAGTPAYMAPEQIECRWRDFGPWTDLYALGIMSFQMVAGKLPFSSEHPMGVLLEHLGTPLPPLRPTFSVPEALAPWVARLCAKAPEARYRRAADALRALRSMGAPLELSAAPAVDASAPPWAAGAADPAPWAGGAGESAPPWSAPAPPWAASERAAPRAASEDEVVTRDARPRAARAREEPAGEVTRDARSSSSAERAEDAPPRGAPPWTDDPRASAAPRPGPSERPPVPEGFGASDEPAPLALHGAGLGLYFLRTIPLVDREEARARGWSALRGAEQSGRPRALVLRGSAGTGKSRIAEWLCERAHETGAAIVLEAVHTVEVGQGDGLPRMLARHYGAVGLEGAELLARLRAQLRGEAGAAEEHAAELAELIAGASAADLSAKRTSVRFASALERYSTVETTLARAARERCVLVWLDDAQWGGDSVAMVAHALDALEAPVLFVLTVREEALAEREREREQIEKLSAHERAETVRVGPLAEDDTALLIEQLLGLSGELAAQVRMRVDGNPLFAVQLVGDWVQRGILQLTPRGFALRPGERAEIPAELGDVWAARIDRALAPHEPRERAALELAAVLGLTHDTGELEAVYAAWGHRLSDDVLEALMRARLVERTEAGWSFAHGMLREVLEKRAAQAGRAAAMHRACAAVLGARGGRGSLARQGMHLADAGEPEAALGPLLAASRELCDESDFGRALELLRRREELMQALALPDGDARWGRGWALRAETHRLEWDLPSARAWAENAREQATRHGWDDVLAEASIVLAHVERQQGDLDRALAHDKTALSLFHRLDHDDGRARALLAMAIIARQRGEFERARELYARAFALFELSGDARGAANAMLGLAHVARHAKAYGDAIRKYEDARELCERAGYRAGVADCLMGRADVQRYGGELALAEDAYREALRIQTRIGSKAAFIARLNLGLVLLEQERFADARAAFEAELPALVRTGKRAYLGWVHHVLLPCAAHAGDLASFDAHAAAARELAAQGALVDEDMALAAERAGSLLAAHGEGARAAEAYALAAAQWRALGDEARAESAQRAAARAP